MRNHYFDNLKFVLILCVVMIHFLECFRSVSASFRALYLFLGTFAMPLFAFVSGYFSKTYAPRLKDLSLLLIPYVFFQLAYIGYYSWLGLDKEYWIGGWSMTTPFIQNWYILSLLGWRLMSLYARQCRAALLISFAAALLVGYEPSISWEFSASRTICFFPFFLLGMKADEQAIERIIRFKPVALLFVSGLLAGCVALSCLAPGKINMVIWKILFSMGYSLPGEVLSGPVFRAILYGVIILSGTAVVALIPQNKTWFTALGTRTLSVFFLHNFFALGLEKINPTYHPGYSELLMLLASVGVTLLLSTKAVYQAMLYPFNAIQRWLERARPAL